jgi:two-component sensor histidine kinase
MTGACLDVTARKQIEEERNVANEKYRLLLRELHHRVTNHLQMITTMLRLQTARLADSTVHDDLETAIQRIHRLAELHGRLYRDEGFDGIEMAAYLGDICDGLRGAVLPPRIDLQCFAAPLKLTLDQAVPLGLIASELVTNATKYAFPGDRPGKVVVRLNPEGNDAILSVADDGIGLPGTAETAGTGLGLTMVRGLAQQIRGILSIENGDGACMTLRFKPERPPL